MNVEEEIYSQEILVKAKFELLKLTNFLIRKSVKAIGIDCEGCGRAHITSLDNIRNTIHILDQLIHIDENKIGNGFKKLVKISEDLVKISEDQHGIDK